jgi:L-threonylcarbamoyladenylate synthase
MSFIGQNIEIAATLLTKGEAVGIPTETVYGLAANALRMDAVSKIFRIKRRPSFDPLIIHVASLDHAAEFVEEIPEPLQKLAQEFMPGPLTLLLRKKSIIPDIVTSGSEYVAVRIPQHPITQSLLRAVEFPLAAPSANPFGYISPTTAQHVADQLGNQLYYILDGGPCTVGIESTIVGLTDKGELHIYRKGGCPISSIEQKMAGFPIIIKDHSSSNPEAPGMLTSHYAPRKPIYLVGADILHNMPHKEGAAYMPFRTFKFGVNPSHQVVLSPHGSFEEAARNLFAGMRYLDSCNIDCIYAEILPEYDLGMAINDRLRRASYKDDIS